MVVEDGVYGMKSVLFWRPVRCGVNSRDLVADQGSVATFARHLHETAIFSRRCWRWMSLASSGRRNRQTGCVVPLIATCEEEKAFQVVTVLITSHQVCLFGGCCGFSRSNFRFYWNVTDSMCSNNSLLRCDVHL